jgi:hypothetical protein
VRLVNGWPQFNWLPAFIWRRWRDLTWARKARAEWMEGMERSWHINPIRTESRLIHLLLHNPYDRDDNVAIDWALDLLKKWQRKGFANYCFEQKPPK